MNPQRLAAVRTLVSRCWSRSRICWALSQEWAVKSDEVEYYVDKIFQELLDAADKETAGARRERVRGAIEEFYDAARRSGDFKAAATALGYLVKIDAGPDRVQVEHTGGMTHVHVKVDDPEAVRQRINALLEKHGTSLAVQQALPAAKL
jgi:hypothetical protein